MSSKFWTTKEIATVRELFASGMCDKEISEHMCANGIPRSPYSIESKRRDIGLRCTPAPKVKPPVVEPVIVAEWAEEELAQMDDAFCAAMKAIGMFKRNPSPPDNIATVPMRASPRVHSHGSGWQL
jgi:hypothetical protein